MKISIARLKEIIMEEVGSATRMPEEATPDMAEVEQLAAALSQVPSIMAAVQEAARIPEVEAADQEAEEELSLQEATADHGYDPLGAKVALTGALGGGAAAGHVAIMSQIGMVAFHTGQALIGGLLGISGGLAIAALGMLIYEALKPNQY